MRLSRVSRKLQIGVMGSAADLQYAKIIEQIAEEIGRLIAQSGNITVYGAEKDYDSLSTAAARGAKKAGGLTVGVTYGKGKDIFDKEGNTDVIICSGLERGGGREFVLVNSCDGIIAVSGGSGTMNEMLVAYQLNIPIVVITGTGGWADKMAGKYFDARKRIKAVPARSPKVALDKILKLISASIDGH
ncbi:MAG: LOG family protein [bacterium]|nr:LOG family protein [bacterium]